jgi:stearoyl-CoA desaturase (delta-9 desaturase)
VQNIVVAVITGGEGWHNYHHAFPMDYRAADEWYQWNPTKWLIQFLGLLGLGWNMRVQKRRSQPEEVRPHVE